MNYSFKKFVLVLNNFVIKYYFVDSRVNIIVNMYFFILDKYFVIVSLIILELLMVIFIYDFRR